jgi:predicted phosphohydrolase
MRLLITADLHYDIPRSRPGVEDLARRAIAQGGDAIVLLGDSAGADIDEFRRCLDRFAAFEGRRLVVPGNHCLWVPMPPDAQPADASLERYETTLPAAATDCGFEWLDDGPVVVGDVALVGSIGWYDYSFRDESLGVPLEFYERKVSPGYAIYHGMDELVARHADRLGARQKRIAARWMDGLRVRLGMTDEAFCRRLNRRLGEQLEAVCPRVERVVALMHHLPFARLVPPDRPDRFAFAAAFLGAERFGRTLLDHPRVEAVYCGHSHWPMRVRVGGLDAVSIGSTYKDKKLEAVEL